MNRFKATFQKLIRKEIVTADSNINFAKKYLIPAIALILILVSIGQFYLSNINENELIEVSGKINSIKFEVFKHYKDTTENRVTININGYSRPFYFIENKNCYFKSIMENVKRNDIITIKHRTKFQSLVGTGRELQIVHLSKDSKEIYSFNNIQKIYFKRGKFGLLCSLIMLLLYIWLKIRYEVR